MGDQRGLRRRRAQDSCATWASTRPRSTSTAAPSPWATRWAPPARCCSAHGARRAGAPRPQKRRCHAVHRWRHGHRHGDREGVKISHRWTQINADGRQRLICVHLWLILFFVLRVTPLQEGVQPRISRIDTNFLSGTGKAIRANS